MPGALRGGSNGEDIMHPVAMTNARSCGVSVAALMAASLLISVPVQVLAQTTTCPAPNPSNVVLLPGYSITAVASCLNFPTAMTFQDDTIWVTEEGTATSPPKVKQIDKMGNVTTMLDASFRSPDLIDFSMTPNRRLSAVRCQETEFRWC